MAKANEYRFEKFNFQDLVEKPSNPLAETLLFYAKSGKFYFLDSLGVETEIPTNIVIGIDNMVAGTDLEILDNLDGTYIINYTGEIIQTKAISFYIDDVLEIGENTMSIISPLGLTIKEIRVGVDVAPTGASLIIDININGTTIYTTQANRPTIAIDAFSVVATIPDITTILLGDKITLDIDQVGSTIAGENLSITIICEVV